MSLLDQILPSFLNPVAAAVSTVVDRLVPDNNASQKLKDQIAIELNKATIAGQLAQLDINKEEAKSSSMFVAGWRPFIGWVCGTALAYQFVGAPVGLWLSQIAGYVIPEPPTLDKTLWELVFAMLGMGGLRTFEKLKGVAS
jgi:hypothetical protein